MVTWFLASWGGVAWWRHAFRPAVGLVSTWVEASSLELPLIWESGVLENEQMNFIKKHSEDDPMFFFGEQIKILVIIVAGFQLLYPTLF